MSAGRTYRFGRAEHSGLVVGVRWEQALILLIGAGAIILALIEVGTPVLAGALALAIAGVASGVAFVPVAGDPLDRWLLVLAVRAWRRARGRTGYRSPQPARGHRHPAPGESPASPPSEGAEELPPALSGVRILAASQRGSEIGVIRQGGTWTVVLSAEGGPFVLLDHEDQERQLAGWGSVLASVARASSPVSRIQWVERTAGEAIDEAGRYLRERVRLPRGHRALASYLQLVEEAGPAARRHELLLAVQIEGRRAGRLIKRAGGGDAGACVVVLREATILMQRLAGAGIEVRGALTPRMVVRALRAGFEPRPITVLPDDDDATREPLAAAPSAAE